MIKIKILLKVIPISIIIILLKIYILSHINFMDTKLNSLIEISDINMIFTGAFFVMGLLLAGVMSDFKESEKIPGEIASNLEAIQDWINLAFKAPRSGTSDLSREELNKEYLRSTLIKGSKGIVEWFNSKEKDSWKIFPLIREFNSIAFYFAERGVDKEAIKGIQENTNAMRKQLTRAYTIARTSFIGPAYTLVRSILLFIVILLLVTKFKSITADIAVTLTLSFLFFYAYFLIVGLDDPFDIHSGDTEVDLKPIDRYIKRLNNNFLDF